MNKAGKDHWRQRIQLEEIGSKYDLLLRDHVHEHYMARRKAIIGAWLRHSPGKLTVDLACGTGTYFDLLVGDRSVIGLDLSLNALSTCRKKFPNRDVILADARAIPIRDNHVGLLLALGLLHHVPDHIETVISEMARILDRNSIAIVDEANGRNPLWHLVMRFSPIDRGNTKPILPDRLVEILRKARLETAASKYYGFAVGPKAVFTFLKRIERIIERTRLKFLAVRFVVLTRRTTSLKSSELHPEP